LRNLYDPGYPPSDAKVYFYFNELPRDNDLSLTANVGIACFIAAAHKTMHDWLEKLDQKMDEKSLLERWYEVMEPTNDRSGRERFFETVIDEAYRVETPFPLCFIVTLTSFS
jgi:hypothetical protein